MTPTQDVVNAGPSVSVDGNGVASRDARVEDADVIVFHEQLVIRTGSAQCVQMIRPILRHSDPRFNLKG